MSIEELKQKESEYYDLVDKYLKMIEDLRYGLQNLQNEYVEENRLYPNGKKFVDECGEKCKITFAYYDRDEIFYNIIDSNKVELSYPESEITKLLIK